MQRAQFQAIALSGLMAVVGCGRTTASNAPDTPETLDKPVVEESAKPLSPAQPVAETPTPAETPVPDEVKPIEQAASAEAATGPAAALAAAPPVLLSKQHAELSRVKVGDSMPEIELPKVLGGDAKLSALYGKAATVVVFWRGDRQMALDELADLGPDVVEKFGDRGVEVVGIAVDEPAANARAAIQKSAANFSQLLDADGAAFGKVGSQKFPWTFVLDANGKIVWFDLEYSLATRRELQQALLATVR